MEEGSISAIITNWLPLVIILGAWFVLLRIGQRQYRRHVNEVNEINGQIVETNREMIAELKQIKQILKDRA